MSKTLTVYHYPVCGTCRQAIKSLKEKNYELNLVHIVEQPPSEAELQQLLAISGLELKKFFNTSGEKYRELGLKDKLPTLSEQEQIKLLSSNGKLIKRPIVTDGEKVTIGYKEDQFVQVWGETK